MNSGPASGEWIDYDFSVVRAVPHVHLESFRNVGVVVHSRTSEYLGAMAITDPSLLAAMLPDLDTELLARYLTNWVGIAHGQTECGPLALKPPSERFHWLTSPRSDVIQSSPIRGGRSQDMPATLDRLCKDYVRPSPND